MKHLRVTIPDNFFDSFMEFFKHVPEVKIKEELVLKQTTTKAKYNSAPVKKTKNKLAFEPMTIKEYKARAEAAEKDIKAGRVKSINKLKKESDNW